MLQHEVHTWKSANSNTRCSVIEDANADLVDLLDELATQHVISHDAIKCVKAVAQLQYVKMTLTCMQIQKGEN